MSNQRCDSVILVRFALFPKTIVAYLLYSQPDHRIGLLVVDAKDLSAGYKLGAVAAHP